MLAEVGKKMKNESIQYNPHSALIQIKKLELEHLGFRVILEKEIDRKNGKRFFVDIYAERDDEKVIIECGYCQKKERLLELKKLTDAKIFHFPYLLRNYNIFGEPYDPMEGKRFMKYQPQ
jgi:hypothetical protein